MSSRSQFPNRRSIRYKGFDYSSAGAYFVTVCTKDRLPVLEDEILRAIVSDVWFALPAWFPTVGLDEFVIMPNHVHFILWLGVGADYLRSPAGHTIQIIRRTSQACDNPSPFTTILQTLDAFTKTSLGNSPRSRIHFGYPLCTMDGNVVGTDPQQQDSPGFSWAILHILVHTAGWATTEAGGFSLCDQEIIFNLCQSGQTRRGSMSSR